MPEHVVFPLLHVHLGPDPSGPDGALPALLRGLEGAAEVRQRAVLPNVLANGRPGGVLPPERIRDVPVGVGARSLWAVGRALGELVADPGGGRRAVQWPVPERWAVVHAHGARALRAVWWAAAWRGSGVRIVASPLRGEPAAGPWRKAELVVVRGSLAREALARRGVGRRRLRPAAPGDAEAHLRLYRRLAAGERRRVQRVDWSLAGGDVGVPPNGRGRR